MKYELTDVDRALFAELEKIKDDKTLIECIFASVYEQSERKNLTEYIRTNPDTITLTEVSLMEVDIHKAREEKRLKKSDVVPKMTEMTAVDKELLDELRKIRKEKQFVNSVFLYAEKQCERSRILEHI